MISQLAVIDVIQLLLSVRSAKISRSGIVLTSSFFKWSLSNTSRCSESHGFTFVSFFIDSSIKMDSVSSIQVL